MKGIILILLKSPVGYGLSGSGFDNTHDELDKTQEIRTLKAFNMTKLPDGIE
jgi:hypothetical protein